MEEKVTFTQNELFVKSVIPLGKEFSISREELCRLTGLSDRKIRMIINDLRCKDLVICSTSNQSGYWYPTKRKEIEDFKEENKKRIVGIAKMNRSANNYLKIHSDQLGM